MKPIVRCKAIGHSWEEFFPVDATRPRWGFAIYLRCVNGCGKARRDVIDMHGNLSHRSYWDEFEVNGMEPPTQTGDTWKSGWRVLYLDSAGASRKKRTSFPVDNNE